jgi:hypothetical protein
MAQIEILREAQQLTVVAANGCAIVRFPDPHVALITHEGVAHEAFVAPVLAEIAQRGRCPLVLAVDAEALSSYETGFRKLWTDWLAANPPSAILVLSHSRLVAMGVAVANAALGGAIRAFSSRAEFEQALAEAREHNSASMTV